MSQPAQDRGLKINRFDVGNNFLHRIIVDDELGAQSLNRRRLAFCF
jgi:hypothetical protein